MIKVELMAPGNGRPVACAEMDSGLFMLSAYVYRFGDGREDSISWCSPLIGASALVEQYTKGHMEHANFKRKDGKGYIPYDWRQKYFRRYLWCQIRPHYRQSLATVDRNSLAIMRTIYSMCGKVGPEHIRFIRPDAPWVHDFTKSRAAAHAVMNTLSVADGKMHWTSAYKRNSDDRLHAHMRRSLEQMPGRLPVGTPTLVKAWDLPRPLVNRADWAFASTISELREELGMRTQVIGPESPYWHVLSRSSPEEMMKMMRLAAGIHGVNKMHSWISYIAAMRYLLDYPLENFNTRMDAQGLFEYALREHGRRCDRWLERSGSIYHEQPQGPYAPPPFPVPDGFTWISSREGLIAESEKMHHCIGTSPHYHAMCINGDAWHFHVDWGGEQATCTLRSTGVYAAHGPRNGQNGAVDYAERMMRGIYSEYRDKICGNAISVATEAEAFGPQTMEHAELGL